MITLQYRTDMICDKNTKAIYLPYRALSRESKASTYKTMLEIL